MRLIKHWKDTEQWATITCSYCHTWSSWTCHCQVGYEIYDEQRKMSKPVEIEFWSSSREKYLLKMDITFYMHYPMASYHNTTSFYAGVSKANYHLWEKKLYLKQNKFQNHRWAPLSNRPFLISPLSVVCSLTAFLKLPWIILSNVRSTM